MKERSKNPNQKFLEDRSGAYPSKGRVPNLKKKPRAKSETRDKRNCRRSSSLA